MTTDEIIAMAREADPFGEDGRLFAMASVAPGTLERFAALVAAKEREACAQIRAMYLRDMRSRAADLAGDIGEATKLLQHSSQRLTERHYRNKAEQLRAVR